MKAYKVYKENIGRLQNPFQNMIFLPEICDKMNKNFYEFEVGTES